jgi:hypothetical protein
MSISGASSYIIDEILGRNSNSFKKSLFWQDLRDILALGSEKRAVKGADQCAF